MLRNDGWWYGREKNDLILDVKQAIAMFQAKFRVMPKTVVVHADEYDNEELPGIEFKLTLANAERKKVIVLWP